MKYFTKEWYELCQKTNLDCNLKVDERASVKDEKLYESLYKKEESRMVELKRDVYDFDPRELINSANAPLIEEDGHEKKREFIFLSDSQRESFDAAVKAYDERPPFDEAKVKKDFARAMRLNKERLVASLTEEIVNKVADMRVLSLGYCTKEVLAEIKKLSKANERAVEKAIRDYTKAQKEEDIPKRISKLTFHDCEVTDFYIENADATMTFDNDGGFTDYDKIIFKSAEITETSGRIIGSYWLYEEVYRCGEGYEIHVLFSKEKLSELIIKCSDVVVGKTNATGKRRGFPSV